MEVLAVTRLRSLQLADNRLRDIPKEAHVLSGLTVLNLQNNLLRFLPPVVCTYINLEVLNLQQNRYLLRLPVEVGLLSALKTLDVDEKYLLSPCKNVLFAGQRETSVEEKNTTSCGLIPQPNFSGKKHWSD